MIATTTRAVMDAKTMAAGTTRTNRDRSHRQDRAAPSPEQLPAQPLARARVCGDATSTDHRGAMIAAMRPLRAPSRR